LFVRDVMTPTVVTVTPDSSLLETALKMTETGYENLVVAEAREPSGVISIKDIGLYRMNHPGAEFASVKVKDLPARNTITCRPDDIIEEAAFLLQKHDLDALPVVEDNGKLSGIVTTSDVLRAFIILLGLRARSTRITLMVPDRVGMLADICQVVRNAGISIASLATFQPAGQDMLNVVVRVKTTDASQVVKKLTDAGYRVIHESHVWE
jgi:acetoin utilization protein AcuB